MGMYRLLQICDGCSVRIMNGKIELPEGVMVNVVETEACSLRYLYWDEKPEAIANALMVELEPDYTTDDDVCLDCAITQACPKQTVTESVEVGGLTITLQCNYFEPMPEWEDVTGECSISFAGTYGNTGRLCYLKHEDVSVAVIGWEQAKLMWGITAYRVERTDIGVDIQWFKVFKRR